MKDVYVSTGILLSDDDSWSVQPGNDTTAIVSARGLYISAQSPGPLLKLAAMLTEAAAISSQLIESANMKIEPADECDTESA